MLYCDLQVIRQGRNRSLPKWSGWHILFIADPLQQPVKLKVSNQKGTKQSNRWTNLE